MGHEGRARFRSFTSAALLGATLALAPAACTGGDGDDDATGGTGAGVAGKGGSGATGGASASGGSGATSGASGGGAGNGSGATGGASSGGDGATGGASSGGTATGGGSGRNGTGGTASGGASGRGGTASGGGAGRGGTGGASSGGASSGGTANGGDAGATGETRGCDDPSLVWRSANKTNYTSYPDPGSEECIEFNGCEWEGQFAACNDKKSEAWVEAHDIVAAFPDFDDLELHDLCLRKGDKTLIVTVLDTCGDSDCSGCCTENQGSADQLIDIESYTNERWGVPDGPIEWADLGPTSGDGCD